MALPPYNLPDDDGEEEQPQHPLNQIYGRIAELVNKAGFQPHKTGYYGSEAMEPEIFRYPDRFTGVGSDTYVALKGDTWESIAFRIYGDTTYASLLQQHNRGTMLQPGVRLVLPDHAIDPRQRDEDVGEWWNTDEAKNEVNAMDEQWRIQNMLDAIEQIWPEHGEEVYIGWDETGSAFPTTDSNGAPLFWDPETNQMTYDDTGIRYTFGMVENDFMRPMSPEELDELDRIQQEIYNDPEAVSAIRLGLEANLHGLLNAAQGEEAEIIEEQIRLLGFAQEVATLPITEELPEDQTYLPSVHGDEVPTFFGELGLGWRAVDLASYGEEGLRGVANVADRELGRREEGMNFLERGWTIITSVAQTAGNVIASQWHLNREPIARLFGGELSPFAVDSATGTRLTQQEIAFRQANGQEHTFRWMNPIKYHEIQADISQATTMRLLASHFDGHLTGIFPENFESDEEYEEYLGHIMSGRPVEDSGYEESKHEVFMDVFTRWENDQQTQAEAATERANLMDIAFRYHQAGNGDEALNYMIQAMNLSTMGAKWYSPYFMWTEMTAPWQHEAFMRAVAEATLEYGEELPESTVRMMRRQYEDAGVDIMMGIVLDITNYIPIYGWAKAAVSMPFKLMDLALPAFRPGVLKAGLNLADWAGSTRVGTPIKGFFDYLFSRAHASTATLMNQKVTNVFLRAARGVDSTLAQPGVKGLDDTTESLARLVRSTDPSAIDDVLPPGMSSLDLWNLRKAAQMYDNAVLHYAKLGEEVPEAIKRLNPENWGQLIHDAHRFVWNKEFARNMEELKKLQPDLGRAMREAQAGRYADELASKPKLVSQQLGNYWEDAYRVLHRTALGPSTLDDNFIVMVGRKLGLDWVTEGGAFRWVFTNFYKARNFLFEWWLGLRPSWSTINYIDSSGRALISGAGLYDDLGTGARLNVRAILGQDLVRPEFKSTFRRMALARGEDEAIDIAESAVERLLRGRNYRWGFLSVLKDSITEAKIQRLIDRTLMKATPDNPAAASLNFIADQLYILRKGLARGANDVNQLMEFGLRQRVFAHHYRNMAAKFGEYNLDALLIKMAETGETGPAAQALRKFWELSNNDGARLSEYLRRAISDPQGPNRQLVSEILPDNFIEHLEDLGVDRRLRALILSSVVDDVEDILKGAPDAATAADEAVEYIDNAIRHINDEFVKQAEQLGSQPHRVGVDDVAPAQVASSAGARSVNAGSGYNETLTIELSDVKKGAWSGFSQQYQDAGKIEAIAISDLFEARRITIDNMVDEGTITPEFREEAVAYLEETYDRLMFFRDKFKNWLLHVYPGPLRHPTGAMRREGFDIVDRVGTQIYHTVTHFANEATENVLIRNTVDELPSLDNLLRNAGIEITWEESRMAAFRFTEDVIGRRSSLTGWRSMEYLKDQLMTRFFGPDITSRQARAYFSNPYTLALYKQSIQPMTAAEVAAMAGTHPAVGQAVDQGIRGADEAWQAFIRNPDHGGGRSLLEMWGWSATKTRDDFIQSLDGAIAQQSALVGVWEGLRGTGMPDKTIDDAVQAIVDSTDLIRQWQAEVLQIGRTIDNITSPFRLLDLGLETGPINVPRWLLDDGVQTWLGMQRGLAAQRYGVVQALEDLKSHLDVGIRDGSVSLTAARLSRNQLQQLADISDEAVWRMTTGSVIASDGSKAVKEATSLVEESPVLDPLMKIEDMLKGVTGGDDYMGAVRITQRDMLEYADNTVFDNLMKFVSPFWMFQSRSPLFWIRTFAQHPEYMAWISKYYRQSRRVQINNGATSTSGEPLGRMFGYWRIPGTSMWVAPLNPLSMRYVIPRDTPYPADFGEEFSAMDVAINHAYEYGRMYGFNPAPWITYPLLAARVLNPDRHPVARFPISHIDLIPPWWQREVLRFLRVQQHPNDPGLFNPDVGWKDYLIQKEILGQALLELERDPDSWPQIQKELYEAFGFGALEMDEAGIPLPFQQQILDPFREHPRWMDARATVENTTWRNQWIGFITGIYPKDMTDAEAAMMQVRDEINFLKDSINSLLGHQIMVLDPVDETRQQFYRDKKWETPEGWIDQFYGTIRWVELPGGGQAYGEDRIEQMAKKIWENEVTAAYYDSMSLITQEYNECIKGIPFGSDSALARACLSQKFEAQRAIDSEPVFDAARRNWMIGYHTEEQIMERAEHMWWRSYILPTKPHWYIEDNEPYESWQERVDEWVENLPMVAEEAANAFLVRTLMPATQAEDDEEGRPVIPDNRVIIPENVIQNLVNTTNAEGYEAYNIANDSAFDAFNAAWKALRWDPYMEATKGWEDLNTYERDLANEAFMEQYGDPPTVDELARWVMENYPDRFTMQELVRTYKGHGAESLEHRMRPNNQVALVTNEVWDMLSAIGPGENYKIFEEEFILAGNDRDMLSAWYESNGNLPFEVAQELHDAILQVGNAIQLKPPSRTQLVEWASAKNMNDQFREDVMGALGRNIFDMIGIYGSLRGDRKKEYKEQYKELIEKYYDMRDFFAEENQLWAKYYHPDKYTGGVGLPGEGAEKRESYGDDVKKYSGGGGFGGRGRGSGGALPENEAFIPQGYRSSYTVTDLFDPMKLGSGGVADVPYWPPGYGRTAPPELLTEIVKLIGKGEPLSDAAVTYMKRQSKWKDYHEKVLKYNSEVSNADFRRSKGLDTDVFSR